MIRMLSNIGRSLVALAALVIIGANTIGGYLVAVGLQSYSGDLSALSEPGQPIPMTPLDVTGALCGFVIGLFMAGLLLGLVATVYDMRDSLRTIAASLAPGSNGGARREPQVRP